MKKITVTLTDEAEKVFNDLMYSLPKDDDGTGCCNQSEAICYALQRMDFLEQEEESPKAVTDGEIEKAAKEYYFETDDFKMSNRKIEFGRSAFANGAKWMREQHGEGAKERYDKAKAKAWEINELDPNTFDEVLRIASGYTEKQ